MPYFLEIPKVKSSKVLVEPDCQILSFSAYKRTFPVTMFNEDQKDSMIQFALDRTEP